MSTERTPYELMQELHSQLLRELVRRLGQPGPSVEVLAVARTFCRAAGGVVEMDAKERAMLVRLRRLHLRKLSAALTSTEHPPSAAVFAEVRQTLAGASFGELAVDVEARESAVKLIKARVPFATS